MCNQFQKLTLNNYNHTINNPVPFSSFGKIHNEFIENSIEHAYDMSLGKKGEYRNSPTGSTKKRSLIQVFENAFVGKVSEYGVYTSIKGIGIPLEEPNCEVYPKGQRDSGDLHIDNFNISVKSTQHYSNALLLNAREYSKNNGIYIPDKSIYDFTFLVRLKPSDNNIYNSIREFKSLGNHEKNLYKLMDLVMDVEWEYDVPGFIRHNDLVQIIQDNLVIPRGHTFHNEDLSTEYYYVQAGDLHKLSKFPQFII